MKDWSIFNGFKIDPYSHIRGNILMANPLPNVSMAYSLLIQDEKQRESYVNNQYLRVFLFLGC